MIADHFPPVFSRFLPMRFSLLFVSALALFASHAAPLRAVTFGCNEYVPANIDIRPVFDDVFYDTSQPMMKIRDLAAGGGTGTQSESWPVGLAVGQFYMNVVKDVYKTRSNYDPSTCGQIKAVHIEMGFAKNVIYVAKEFPKRSCPYKTILGHEEMHKTVDRNLLREYSDKAKGFFSDAAKTIGVIRNGAGAAIDTEIGENMSRAMDQFSGQLEDERRRRQKEVDSSEEYARVSAACDGDLMAIVNDRLALLEESAPGITKPVEKKMGTDAGKADTPAPVVRGSPATLARPSNIPQY